LGSWSVQSSNHSDPILPHIVPDNRFARCRFWQEGGAICPTRVPNASYRSDAASIVQARARRGCGSSGFFSARFLEPPSRPGAPRPLPGISRGRLAAQNRIDERENRGRGTPPARRLESQVTDSDSLRSEVLNH